MMNSKAIASATLMLLPISAITAKESPNVIVILTDDQGYGDIEAHGNPILKTPNINKLHDESVRFTDFHVAPMSSPTRGELMTGVSAMRSGCTAVCQGRSMPNLELKMMPEYFKDMGYSTGHFGKWHLGNSYPYRPQDRGFDVTLHFPSWGITSIADTWGNSYFDPTLLRGDKKEKFEGYSTDIFFDEAMAYIKQCKEQGKPSFTYLATNTPHVPEMVAEKYSAPYAQIGEYNGKIVPDIFYGMIANIDENMGRLDKFLVDNDLKDNTILVYLTDNGTQNAKAMKIFNAKMRDKKTSAYEGGHRVPLYIRWNEGGLIHGTDRSELTVVRDLLPTLLDLCGGDVVEFDGVTLRDLVVDKGATLEDRIDVVQYNTGDKWEGTAVMWNKWRLVDRDKLFNIAKDPTQKSNIAAQNPEILAKLSSYYDRWYDEVRPMYERERYITIGCDKSNPTMLYSGDWNGGYCDNLMGLYRSQERGYFDIDVAKAGKYEITLRRWAEDTDGTISGYIEGFAGGKAGFKPEDAAKPITKAQLNVGESTQSVAIDEKCREVTFKVTLPKGKCRMEGLFLNEQNDVVCGAIYTKVLRK